MFDSGRKRWLALIVLCLGDLMIVLDTTIVNVALPSIREDLAFTETSLVWVVNAYMLTYGGFLLLGGRLGGLLTDALSWHWVFLVNIPIGVAVYALTVILLRESRAPAAAARLDVGGAVTVTASLLLAVYAVVNGNEAGWTSAQTLT